MLCICNSSAYPMRWTQLMFPKTNTEKHSTKFIWVAIFVFDLNKFDLICHLLSKAKTMSIYTSILSYFNSQNLPVCSIYVRERQICGCSSDPSRQSLIPLQNLDLYTH